MQQLKTIKFFLSILLLTGCFGNSPKNTNKENNSSDAQTISTSDASFSCMLDNKEFSGTGTDQNINAAFHLTGDNKGQVLFRFSKLDNPGEKLMFQVAAKEGSTTFNVTPTSSRVGYITKGYINYLDDPLTVTITLLSAARISGTFSGKYTLDKGSGDANTKQTILVTDGKFDIPFSTSAQWKQMYQAE
ncbi:MAG TPA: hypothetical protein VGP55_03955 [Chitinophagaceae bacterium]|nr:hypothetical protein [Chitinophagaceae bacterium]